MKKVLEYMKTGLPKTLDQIHQMNNYDDLFTYFKWLVINFDCKIKERPNKEELKRMIDDRNSC